MCLRERAGTFPLHDAQLDRFAIRISLNLPTRAEEVRMLQSHIIDEPVTHTLAVCSTEDWQQMMVSIKQVEIHPDVQGYIVDVVRAIRDLLGATAQLSPRAALWLQRISQSLTWLRGQKGYVTPDVVIELLPFILIHRCTGAGLSDHQLAAAVASVKVPT